MQSAIFDDDTRQWTVQVDRDGEQLTLTPHQLVLATGMSRKPNVPTVPGQDVFEGDPHNSSRHPGPEEYAGKRAVVVGSNSSAHDICAALWEAGADVTMVKRSPTHIVVGAADLVADKVGKVWGLGSDTAKDRGPWEGEQRNMWKPTQQEVHHLC